MKTIAAFCLLVVTLCFSLLSNAADSFGKPLQFSNGNSASIQSSIVALLGNPEKWEGKPVSVIGFIATDLHGVFLFMSSELCRAWAIQYAVLVELEAIQPPVEYHQLPEKPCALAVVEGRFFEIPREDPEPDVYVFRDRPAWIEAKYVQYK